MTEKHSLSWKGGEIDIWTLGCKIVPKFKLNDKIISDEKFVITEELFQNRYLKLSIGKKRHIKIELI